MNNKKVRSILISIILIFSLILLLKLVIYDCAIGRKIYDQNNIIIKYHKYINIVSIKNNSDTDIYMHYQYGRCRKDTNFDKRYFDIRYYKKSDVFEIKKKKKILKFTSIIDDAYIFTVSNKKKLYDSVGYNKHKLL